MKTNIARFHYLTQDNIPGKDPCTLVQNVCEAGVRWVQFRSKLLSYPEIKKTALAIKKITDSFGAVLIINDWVEMAKEIKAHGVHLGRDDMKADEVRKLLGDGFIIGFTVNSEKEAVEFKNLPVDYFGVGPFRFTNTKANLSPVLGIDGIQKISNILTPKPVIAIGGIRYNDVKQILKAGIYGFAVSSGINYEVNMGVMVGKFKKEVIEIGNHENIKCKL